MEERTYSAEEVETIVRNATRLQDAFRERSTIADIERAAAEFGVESRFVQLAASQLEAPQEVRVPEKKEDIHVSGLTWLQLVITILAIIHSLLCFGYISWQSQTSQPAELGILWPFWFVGMAFGGVAAASRRPHVILVPIALSVVAAAVAMTYTTFFTSVYMHSAAFALSRLALLIVVLMAFCAFGYAAIRVAERITRTTPKSEFTASP